MSLETKDHLEHHYNQSIQNSIAITITIYIYNTTLPLLTRNLTFLPRDPSCLYITEPLDQKKILWLLMKQL
jgi:hypothetical protein